jgi:hypothetical protein
MTVLGDITLIYHLEDIEGLRARGTLHPKSRMDCRGGEVFYWRRNDGRCQPRFDGWPERGGSSEEDAKR